MKKQLLFTAMLFVCSWQLLSQNKAIIINDSATIAKIEGDWYGVHHNLGCNQGGCLYPLIRDISGYKIKISLKDSILKASYKKQTKYNIYSELETIETFKTTSTFRANDFRNEKNYLFNINFEQNYSVLGNSGFEVGTFYYTKNPKYYYQLLLTSNDWLNDGCYIPSNQSKNCISNNQKIDAFSLNKDTLFYYNPSRANIKFIFDERDYLYKDVVDPVNTLKVLNDSTLMFIKNKDTVLVNRLNEAISTAKSPFIGTWNSTRNSNRYIKANESFIETNINDTLRSNNPNNEIVNKIGANYYFQNFIANGDSTNEMYFYLTQSMFRYGKRIPVGNEGMVYQFIPYKIVMLKNGSIMDIATGEVFSKILDLNDEDLKKEITLSKTSENQIQLNSSISLTNAQLTLYDMKGSAFAVSLQQDNTIEVSNLQAGLYVLRLQTADQKMASFKFVK
jgi:hypothetical protein